jgi:hypothetical protein
MAKELNEKVNGSRRQKVIRRSLLWLWIVVWPVLSLFAASVGHEIMDRAAPQVVDELQSKVGLGGPLVVIQDWPGNECTGTPAVAYPAPAPDARRFLGSNAEPDQFTGGVVDAVVNHGGAVYETGMLLLRLSAVGDTTVVIYDVQVVSYARDNRTLAWAALPQGECGGSSVDTRNYTARLDVQHPKLHLQRTDSAKTSDSAIGKFESFMASAADPTDVAVEATQCSGYHEWGIRILYTARGHKYEAIVGHADEPFRIAGGPVRGVYVGTNSNAEWSPRSYASLKAALRSYATVISRVYPCS